VRNLQARVERMVHTLDPLLVSVLLTDSAHLYLQKMARFSSSKPPSQKPTNNLATASSLSRDGNVAAALDEPVEPFRHAQVAFDGQRALLPAEDGEVQQFQPAEPKANEPPRNRQQSLTRRERCCRP
jgi:hypothetical protein